MNEQGDINGTTDEVVDTLSRSDMKAIVAFTKAIVNMQKTLKVIADNTDKLVGVFEKEDGAFNQKIKILEVSMKAEIASQRNHIIIGILAGFAVVSGIFAFIVNAIENSKLDEIVKKILEILPK